MPHSFFYLRNWVTNAFYRHHVVEVDEDDPRAKKRAELLFQGRGVPKDLVESYKWFALAHQSLPPGLDRERSAKATSLIEASLPHDQLQAARASAASWKPTE